MTSCIKCHKDVTLEKDIVCVCFDCVKKQKKI